MKRIPLTRGYEALVDDGDYDWLMQWKWCVALMPGAPKAMRVTSSVRGQKPRTVYMHRVIMGAPKGMEVDHINHDTLDNRRSTNLRICTRSQNMANQRKQAGCSSQYKGVSWSKQRGKWHAQIRVDQKRQHLGLFTDERDAARAYNKAALAAFGEFALLNDV